MTALATGFLLGGTVGIGTVLYALAIGPLVQFFLKRVPDAAVSENAAQEPRDAPVYVA